MSSHFETEEPLFRGLLGTLAVCGVAFVSWVATAAPILHDDLEYVEPGCQLLPTQRIPLPEPEVTVEALAETPSPTPTPKPRPAPAPSPTRTDAPVQEEPHDVLIQLIGQVGKDGKTVVDDVFASIDAGQVDLDDALRNVSGAQNATLGTDIPRVVSDRRDIGIGVGKVAGHGTELGSGADTKIAGRIRQEDPESIEAGDPQAILKVIKGNRGRVQTCVESSVKSDPNLAGRITVEWSIRAGRVISAAAIGNTTGDTQLGECLVRAVRGMRFPVGMDADNVQVPWVVSGQ